MKRIVIRHRLIVSSWLAAALLLIAVVAVSAAVTLMIFKADSLGNDIIIRWQTGSEFDASGFLVMKSIDAVSGYDHLGDFVYARGGVSSGATYVVTDTEVTRGVTYFYMLYSYDNSSNFVPTGPISFTMPLTPTLIPTRAPTSTPTAPNTPTQIGPPTATRPPTNTPTPLSVGASTITPSAPQAPTSAATATWIPTVTSTPAQSTATSLPTASPVPTERVSTTPTRMPPTAPSTQDPSANVEPSSAARSLIAMEPMVIATSEAPAASTPTSGGGLDAFVIGLLVLAALLVGAGLFAILRQTGR